MGGGTDQVSEPRYSAREIQDRAAELEIDTPYSVRIVGDRIEYHTRDGVIRWPRKGKAVTLGGSARPRKVPTGGERTLAELKPLLKADLLVIAGDLAIARRSKMTKALLIEAIVGHHAAAA